ncbi:fibronectin type III domain-containing protein-like [Daktulosphaira vitifoliae]|uniref:fibronectin type III domain-containing protein-like n=1 Tax=Daktulosphaira vitifoliae TaxID=58002 RepID=UPI0021AA7C0E|nr:fibronectin type III domain-containing protein-like [Daktulosphaira vitifoliae]
MNKLILFLTVIIITTITIRSSPTEDSIPGPPSDLKVYPQLYSCNIKWEAPLGNTVVTKYIASWGEEKKFIEIDAKVVENYLYYEIRPLEPNTDYVISLAAGNSKGIGPSISKSIRTEKSHINFLLNYKVTRYPFEFIDHALTSSVNYIKNTKKELGF